MRITIIPTDNTIYIDSIAMFISDINSCDIPNNVHALQWFDTKGWIEYKELEDAFEQKPQNQVIEKLPDWAIKCINNAQDPIVKV